MQQKQPIILPEKYYLDYFNYLVDFVTRHYEHVLESPEYFFVQQFRDLSEDAQCLYLRLSNRRGDFFRLTKINYAEIINLDSAKEELLLNEFIDINESNDPSQFRLFTKAELLHFFNFLDKKDRKADLLLSLTSEDILTLHDEEEILEVKKNQEVEFLKLLFFGNRYEQMTEFVIRDVGNIHLKPLDENKFKPWFQKREEALGVMHISQLKGMIREIIQADLPLEEFIKEMPWNEWLKHPRSKEAAEKLLIFIGNHFEKQEKFSLALTYYNLTIKPPSRERQIRILEKLRESEEAVHIAKEILEQPSNASELTFASDYLNRSGIRIDRSMTKKLQSAKILELAVGQNRVEHQVLEHYIENGWLGIHAENFIWRSLFGMVFWDELFNEDYGTFHHPLQRQPSDLQGPEFFNARQPELENRLRTIKTRKQLFKYIFRIYEENKGIANRFVYWNDQLLSILEKMINRLPLKGLKQVLLEIAKQTKENSTGFPDLFIWKDDDYQFIEVKSPKDHLSAQQLFWLEYLTSVKIKAEVVRVKYQG